VGRDEGTRTDAARLAEPQVRLLSAALEFDQYGLLWFTDDNTFSTPDRMRRRFERYGEGYGLVSATSGHATGDGFSAGEPTCPGCSPANQRHLLFLHRCPGCWAPPGLGLEWWLGASVPAILPMAGEWAFLAAKGRPAGAWYPAVWIAREVPVPPLWMGPLLGSAVRWRGRRLRLGR